MPTAVLEHSSQALSCLNFYQITWPFSIVEILPQCSLRTATSLKVNTCYAKGAAYDEIRLGNECYVKHAALR